MDSQPLDAAEAWRLAPWHLDPLGPRPRPITHEHPAWNGRGGVEYQPVEPGRRHLSAWVGGEGTATHPWVVEVSTRGRWPNLAELRGALRALTHEGAVFEFAFPFLAALPFTEIPPVLMVQVTAVPGSAAEQRLKLSGGVRVMPPGAPPPTTNGGIR